MLLFVGIGSQMALVGDASAAAIVAVLDQVGARLKGIRTRRGMTLTGVAEATGISKSTLSRLETGQRPPEPRAGFNPARAPRRGRPGAWRAPL